MAESAGTEGAESAGALSVRKMSHIEACLHRPVGYTTRTTGFERYELPYTALPESDLAATDIHTMFLGKPLAAPVLIGAMTGGSELSERINRNLAIAAAELNVGLMLGSQRVMLANPAAAASFAVREFAPDVLLIGNLGIAQLNKGYGAAEMRRAVEWVGADALALHTNPLQEACQDGGDTDFTRLVERLTEVVPQVPVPVLLKEVGHGLSGRVAASVADTGLAALDVAGAGGTSWARVEQLARYGEVLSPELAEWGIPTSRALIDVHAAVPGVPLVASGGVRSGMDAAKAFALGASVVAVAHPLLAPAVDSPDAVVAWLRRFIGELRVAMHCVGASDVAALRGMTLSPDPGSIGG
ncbi:MAG: type 2 isopentenyl-diphosphate Delta-isomerase [Sciscionella sp.]